VSIESVLARIQDLEQAFSPRPKPAATTTQAATATPGSFSSKLQQASSTSAAAGVSPVGGSVGQRIVQIAEGEVGQAEQPPGSNDSPRIAQYRSATAGSPGPGPWCAYFASWVARQAGVPVGDQGQGFGAVDDLWSWAQSSGKAVPSGQPPRPGDLMIMNEHVGIVESVLPNGQVQTVEGNYADKVSRNVRPVSDAIGFVRLG
jgi:hypothetical protein